MNTKTVEKEFRLRGIDYKVKRFKSDKLKCTGYTIHRDTGITLCSGGRLVCIDSIEDVDRIANKLKMKSKQNKTSFDGK